VYALAFIATIVVFVLLDNWKGTKFVEYKPPEKCAGCNYDTPTPTIEPKWTSPNGLASETNIFYAEHYGEPLMKIEFSRYTNNVTYALKEGLDPKVAMVIKESGETELLASNEAKIASIPVMSKKVEEQKIASTIFIADTIIDFKQIPNTNKIVFVMQ
jgi:hypothetical protein